VPLSGRRDMRMLGVGRVHMLCGVRPGGGLVGDRARRLEGPLKRSPEVR
jgi:hypothetical protein